MPEALFRALEGKSHDQIAVLQDGRVIAMGKNYTGGEYIAADGCIFMNVRVPDLRMIEYILNVQFDTSPTSCTGVIAMNKTITGNVVGMTIHAAAAVTEATLIAEVIAIGPP